MGARPWQGKGVVIVDDSPMVREQLRGVFEQIGMKVMGVAENGVVGLELAATHQPDLISLDLIMPEMDGVECFKKLRAWNADQKIVIVSWLGAEPKILDNLKAMIPPHLFQAKPVAAEDLEARVAKVYGLVPVVTEIEEIDTLTADLKALSARVS